MRRTSLLILAIVAAVAAAASPPGASAGGVLESLWGHSGPPTLADAARMIDHIESSLLNQGTVVVKQPDVWSQARMTKFRKEFEDSMALELNKFQAVLSGRIARSDAAALQSQTALGASLTPLKDGSSFATDASTISTQRDNAIGLIFGQTPGSTTNSGSQMLLPALSTGTTTLSNFNLLTGTTGATSNPNVNAFGLNYGLDPNVNTDEKADFISHLHRIRRVNLGDDNADSAGYGMYLVRVPVSVSPGDKTKKGFGAVVNLTVQHDFGPKFLSSTYRNLVINDLVDELAPVVQELIRNGAATEYHTQVGTRTEAQPRGALADAATKSGDSKKYQLLADLAPVLADTKQKVVAAGVKSLGTRPVNRNEPYTYPIAPSDLARVFLDTNLLTLAFSAQEALDLVAPSSMTADQATAFLSRVRLIDVRSYLKQELAAAYDLMEGRCSTEAPLLQDVGYIESLADDVACRKYEGPKEAGGQVQEELNAFWSSYESFTNRLPGNLRYRPVGALCWAVAIEAGLLNRQLRSDMAQTKGADGSVCPEGTAAMMFYPPTPEPDAEHTFLWYVKNRWPMITFALEPVTDEQNIDDAFTRRRDLQLAVSFALSSGRISFRQALQFTRQLQFEAQTIALNQTVTAFAHGTDSFGWRISPRFQTPPEESNLRTVTNLLLRGGPGPNFQLAHSKIEPGLREMTAVVVMPSFVRSMRVDVSGDWFRLSDPDEQKLKSARAVEFGRRINEARDCLETACKCGKYRPEDVERLRVRLLQLERMLPIQTQFVKVPFENTLGGFALFTQGASALAPELSGFEGADAYNSATGTQLVIYGKHMSLYETEVVAGGRALAREGNGIIFSTDANGKPATAVTTVTPLLDASGKLLQVFNSTSTTGTPINVADNGSFNILSREVMRVRLPTGLAFTTRADGSKVVELTVSTPNGISNKILIPYTDGSTPAAAAPVAATATLTVTPDPIVLSYLVDGTTKPETVTGFNAGAPSTSVSVQLAGAESLPPSQVDVTFSVVLPVSGSTASYTVPGVAYDPKAKAYPIGDKLLENLGEGFLAAAKDVHTQSPSNWTGTLSSVVLKSGPATFQAATTNKFTFDFRLPVTPPPGGGGAGGAGGAGAGTPPPSDIPGDLPPLGGRTASQLDRSTRRTSMLQQVATPATPAAPQVAPPVTPAIPASGQAAAANLLANLPPLPPGQAAALVNALTNGPAVPASNAGMLVIPSPPANININVPIHNATDKAKRHGLFHRQPATPQNPTKPSLLERITGNP